MNPAKFWSFLSRPPEIIQIDAPAVLLSGGLSRLQLEFSGWGRLDVDFLDADGCLHTCRRHFMGGYRIWAVDIRPPGVLTIRAKNPFGQVKVDRKFSSAFKTPDPVDIPSVAAFPAPPLAPQSPVPTIPVPQFNHVVPQFNLVVPKVALPKLTTSQSFNLRLPNTPNLGPHLE